MEYGTVAVKRTGVMRTKSQIWLGEVGQNVAEYAVLLALILVLMIGAVRLIGVNTTNVFSRTADSIEHHPDAD
jgi:Flp pilus assembly pilin Flp